MNIFLIFGVYANNRSNTAALRRYRMMRATQIRFFKSEFFSWLSPYRFFFHATSHARAVRVYIQLHVERMSAKRVSTRVLLRSLLIFSWTFCFSELSDIRFRACFAKLA